MKNALEEKIFGAMATFIQKVHRAADASLAETGLTPAQFFVLATLSRRRECRQTELARILGVTAGNISQLVTKLEQAGLVKRVGDGKANLVALLPDGDAMVRVLMPEHERFLRAQFDRLRVEERKNLLALLEKLGGDQTGR